MDLSLRCNSLKCRQTLSDRAVVTTCSHIFCVPCSDTLGLSGSANGIRICPACDAQLANQDDAVITLLNPTEDYKTSVLSGLSPTIIMECCTRGMSFYQYQVTQEIMYHDYMAKNLADRYATLNSQMDNVIKDANSEISGLRDRLERMHLDKKTLEQKNQELIRAFGEKSKAHQRLTKLYQRAKGTQDAQQMQYAAADDVDNVIQSMQGPGGFVEGFRDRITTQRPASLPGARGGGGGGQELPQVYSHGRVGSYGSAQKNQSWTNQGSREHAQDIITSGGGVGMSGFGLGQHPTPSQRQATPNRQPLGDTHPNRSVRNSHDFLPYGSGGGTKIGGGGGGSDAARRPQIINRNISRVVHR